MKFTPKTKFTLSSILLIAGLALAVNAQATGKHPVIVIPGIQGSEIIDAARKNVWFSIHRGKPDDLRLPIGSTNLAGNRDSLKAGDVIRKVDLKLLPDIEVYQSLIDALQSKGYHEATWNSPKAADVFYLFAYDWRRDNVENARLLMQRMEAVKRRLRMPRLKFDVIAHSMGGLIARYAAMYGKADLPSTGQPAPTWAGAAHIDKLMMFGTPNQGSFSAFEALLNGAPVIANRKLPLVDDFRNEDVFTLPSVYELLPHEADLRFFDGNLQPIRIDLYDADNWLKYGWGAIADPKFLAKLKDADQLAAANAAIKPKPYDGKGNDDDRLLSQVTFAQARAYLGAVLDRARRFNAALDVPTTKQPIKLYIYGGNCAPTLNGAVIISDKDGKWTTLIDDKEIKTYDGRVFKKEDVKALLYTLGDGRVTLTSLVAAGKPLAADAKVEFFGASYPIASSLFTCGSHTKLFLEKPIQDSFLSALVVTRRGQP
jgi:hypothetical protein